MTVFTTTLKRIVRNPLNLLFVCLFPLVFALLISFTVTAESGPDEIIEIPLYFGIVDQDESALSKALVNRLETRFNIVELSEDDISAKLTDQDVPWVLLIRGGYERDLLAGKEPVLEGYSIALSDVAALGSATAENITRALLLLGTNDTQAISDWEEASRVEVAALPSDTNWAVVCQWFGFFGFITMYTAYFIVRTMMEDKKRGMPDRIGVLPHSPGNHLTQGVFAVFIATEVTVAATFLVIQGMLGEVPNAPYLFVLLSLYNLFAVGFALSVFTVMPSSDSTAISITMLSTILAMLGGLFWPLEFVPEFMRKLAWFSPGYWLSRGLNGIQEITFENYVMPLLFLAGFTILTLLLGGVKKMRAAEG